MRASDVVVDHLDRSAAHLANSDWRAAAVYARSAFEMWLKLQCDSQRVPIQYSFEPRKIDSNVYFNSLEKWADNNHAKPAFAGVLNVLGLYCDTVFNSGSHSYPTTMGGGEQRAAIAAMRFVNNAGKHSSNALQMAQHLIEKAGATPEELVLAAGYLRVAFLRRLREFAQAKQLALPFTMESYKTTPQQLWDAMTNAGWPAKRNKWVTGINASSRVFLDTWTWSALLTLSVTDLQNALQALKQH